VENDSWSQILGEKMLPKIRLSKWKGPHYHVIATQKHNTIYLEWGIKFGVLGENKGRNNKGCESQIRLKMREESQPRKA